MNAIKRHAHVQMGFTLLEALIALTVLGLMMTVLLGGLRFGARSWDAAEARADAAGSRALVQGLIRRLLLQARPVMWGQHTTEPSIAFVGEGERLRFVAPLPAHRGWGGLYLVTLELARADNQGRLLLSYRLFHPDTLEDSLQGQYERRDVLLEGVRNSVFEYFGPGEIDATPHWQTSWRQRQQLPTLVRLRIDAQDEIWPELVVALRLVNSTMGPGPLGGGGVDFGPLPH